MEETAGCCARKDVRNWGVYFTHKGQWDTEGIYFILIEDTARRYKEKRPVIHNGLLKKKKNSSYGRKFGGSGAYMRKGFLIL